MVPMLQWGFVRSNAVAIPRQAPQILPFSPVVRTVCSGFAPPRDRSKPRLFLEKVQTDLVNADILVRSSDLCRAPREGVRDAGWREGSLHPPLGTFSRLLVLHEDSVTWLDYHVGTRLDCAWFLQALFYRSTVVLVPKCLTAYCIYDGYAACLDDT